MGELKKLLKRAFTMGFGSGWKVGYAAGMLKEEPPAEAILSHCGKEFDKWVGEIREEIKEELGEI